MPANFLRNRSNIFLKQKGQYTTDVPHIESLKNIVAVTLSRLKFIACPRVSLMMSFECKPTTENRIFFLTTQESSNTKISHPPFSQLDIEQVNFENWFNQAYEKDHS